MNMVDGGINNLGLALLKYEDSGARHAEVSWENETKKGPVFEIFQFSKKIAGTTRRSKVIVLDKKNALTGVLRHIVLDGLTKCR